MVSQCHPSLRAGAADGGSRGHGFRRRRRLGSSLPLVVGSLLAARPQVGPGSGVAWRRGPPLCRREECTSKKAIGGGVCMGRGDGLGLPGAGAAGLPGLLSEGDREKQAKWVSGGRLGSRFLSGGF